MIGEKVVLTKSYAKWYLQHPEIFECPVTGEMSEGFDETIQMSIATLLGVPMIGTVIKPGADKNGWGVKFKTKFGTDYAYYIYPYHITKLTKELKNV